MQWCVVFVWFVYSLLAIQALPIETPLDSSVNATESDGTPVLVQERRPSIASIVVGEASSVQQAVEPTLTSDKIVEIEPIHQASRDALDVPEIDRPRVSSGSTTSPLSSLGDKMNQWKQQIFNKLERPKSTDETLKKRPSFLNYLKSKLSSNSLKPQPSMVNLFEPQSSPVRLPDDCSKFPPIRKRTKDLPNVDDPFSPEYSITGYDSYLQLDENRKNRHRHRRARVFEDQYFSSDDDTPESGAWRSFQESEPEYSPELVWFDEEDDVTEEWNQVFKSMKKADISSNESPLADESPLASFSWPEPPNYPPPSHLVSSSTESPLADSHGKTVKAIQSLDDLQASILKEYPIQEKVDVESQ